MFGVHIQVFGLNISRTCEILGLFSGRNRKYGLSSETGSYRRGLSQKDRSECESPTKGWRSEM